MTNDKILPRSYRSKE